METPTTIIYRQKDAYLSIMLESGAPNYGVLLDDLTLDQQLAFESLKDLCETKIPQGAVLEYVIYNNTSKMLNVQQKVGGSEDFYVPDMPEDEKTKVDAVGYICVTLVNE